MSIYIEILTLGFVVAIFVRVLQLKGSQAEILAEFIERIDKLIEKVKKIIP